MKQHFNVTLVKHVITDYYMTNYKSRKLYKGKSKVCHTPTGVCRRGVHFPS